MSYDNKSDPQRAGERRSALGTALAWIFGGAVAIAIVYLIVVHMGHGV